MLKSCLIFGQNLRLSNRVVYKNLYFNVHSHSHRYTQTHKHNQTERNTDTRVNIVSANPKKGRIIDHDHYIGISNLIQSNEIHWRCKSRPKVTKNTQLLIKISADSRFNISNYLFPILICGK